MLRVVALQSDFVYINLEELTKPIILSFSCHASMRVTEVSIPKSSFRTAPGVGVTLRASQIFLALTGDWHYKTRGW